MTYGDVRQGQRIELAGILRDCLTLLEDERVVDRPYELSAVAMALSVAMPLADNLAQTPKPMKARPLEPVIEAVIETVPVRFHRGGEIVDGIGTVVHYAD